jgi:energy-coupling factor transport system permease protein
MIKDITLGQYFPGESFIHRLDPRTKIVITLAYLVSLFLVKTFAGFAVAAVFLIVCSKIARIPMRIQLNGLKGIMFIILLTAVVNLFATSGTVLWQWHFIRITQEGLYRAGFMAIRLTLLILGSTLMTLTTKPLALTDGLERMFSPFRKIGLPAHELAMMISIALRFIPTLLDETDKIMKAQTSRGADFESGNLFQRAKSLVPLLVPLFVSAFRIAGDLAMAMEARCYRGGEGRTRMNGMAFSKNDAVAVLVFIAYLAVIISLNHITILA